MKFRLISRQDVDEGTGEIPDAFAGPPHVLVWRGRCFVWRRRPDKSDGLDYFHEVYGQALDYHQVTPPARGADHWTTPTAIGRMAAEQRVDVVDSVAPGYVLNQTQARRAAKWKEDQASAPEEERFRWDVVDDSPPVPAGDPSIAAIVGAPRRRRGEPS